MASLALRGAAAEDHLYPHAERTPGPWGYIDKTGRIVIPLQFEAAEPFSEGLAAVEVHNKEGFHKTYGFIDRTGHLVIPARFNEVRPFESGRAAVRIIRKGWGLIDRDGAEVVPLAYSYVRPFREGRAIVSAGNQAGVMDLSGQWVIQPEYEAMGDYSEGLAAARRGGKFGFVDKDGTVVIPFRFRRVLKFENGKARVFGDTDGRSGFVDKTGALVASFDFDFVYEFNDGFAVVRKKGKYGLVDVDGKIVISPRFAQVGRRTDEFANIGRSRAIPPTRAYASFSDGLLPASPAYAQFGYVDKGGNFVIPPSFDEAFAFDEGRAVVKVSAERGLEIKGAKGRVAGLIDRSGQFVLPPIFDWIAPHPGGLWQVKFGDRLGYVDASGQTLTFSRSDLDTYVTEKREQITQTLAKERERFEPQAPPPGDRAVFAKAGDNEYYLRLPESHCALDDTEPADRKILDDYWVRSAKAFEAAKAAMPMPKDIEEAGKAHHDFARLNSRIILRCDQRERLRAGASWQSVQTYIMAMGTQKDRYDPSAGAGGVFASALMCGMLKGDVFKWSDSGEKDRGGTIAAAFKRLEGGEPVALRTNGLLLGFAGCYIAGVVPARDNIASPDLPAKAKLRAMSLLFLGDWLVSVITDNPSVSSPDEFFREFERDRALIQRLLDANQSK